MVRVKFTFIIKQQKDLWIKQLNSFHSFFCLNSWHQKTRKSKKVDDVTDQESPVTTRFSFPFFVFLRL